MENQAGNGIRALLIKSMRTRKCIDEHLGFFHKRNGAFLSHWDYLCAKLLFYGFKHCVKYICCNTSVDTQPSSMVHTHSVSDLHCQADPIKWSIPILEYHYCNKPQNTMSYITLIQRNCLVHRVVLHSWTMLLYHEGNKCICTFLSTILATSKPSAHNTKLFCGDWQWKTPYKYLTCI